MSSMRKDIDCLCGSDLSDVWSADEPESNKKRWKQLQLSLFKLSREKLARVGLMLAYVGFLKASGR